MTSKTSYFEPALFLRGLKKTFPVWLAYVVLWVLFLPLSILNRAQWDPKAADIRELILSSAIASVVTTAILALALAWVLFRFLFRTATSYDIAALPVRRESLFLTNLLCGLAIALGTHLLIALITYGASALIGFPNLSACMELVAAAMLAFLGFFGFAVLLCIIVGNAVAMPLIYIVLNFTVFVVVQISTELLSNFVYGLGSVSDSVLSLSLILSPILLVFSGNIQLIWGWNADYTDKARVDLGGFPYFYIFAAMGLVCAVLAFFLFRRREMERSGDVVAIRALRPVFLCLFSLGCALVIGYLLAMFVSNADYNFPLMLALQLAGAFLGYFAAQKGPPASSPASASGSASLCSASCWPGRSPPRASASSATVKKSPTPEVSAPSRCAGRVSPKRTTSRPSWPCIRRSSTNRRRSWPCSRASPMTTATSPSTMRCRTAGRFAAASPSTAPANWPGSSTRSTTAPASSSHARSSPVS